MAHPAPRQNVARRPGLVTPSANLVVATASEGVHGRDGGYGQTRQPLATVPGVTIGEVAKARRVNSTVESFS